MRSRLLSDNNRWQPVLKEKVPSDELTAIAHAAVGTFNKRLTSSRQPPPPQPPGLFKLHPSTAVAASARKEMLLVTIFAASVRKNIVLVAVFVRLLHAKERMD